MRGTAYLKLLTPLMVGMLLVPACSTSVVSIDGYRFDRTGQTATGHAEGEISPNTSHIRVEHQFGKVRVEATDGAPKWSWDLTCWANTRGLADLFRQRITLQIDEMGEHCTWKLILPDPPVPQLRGVESNLTLTVPASVKVDLENSHGETEICAVDGGTRARCRFCKLLLSDVGGQIDAETSYGELVAERISGGKLRNHYNPIQATGVAGDLEVKNGHGTIQATDVVGDLTVENQHGTTEIHNVTGELTVNSDRGKIIASGIARVTKLKTSYADIALEDAAEEVVLRSQRGNITAKKLCGPVQVENAYGTIELEVESPNVVCKNRHGKINLSLIGPAISVVEAETSHGDLEVGIAESLSPRIWARASHGGEVKSPVYPFCTMDAGTNSFQGEDATDPRITLKNQHGDIRINKLANDVTTP